MLILATVLCAVIATLLYSSFLKRHEKNGSFVGKKIRMCVVMGSGGHTTEMVLMMKQLLDCCSHRFYIVAETDQMSEKKVNEFESKGNDFKIVKIPRSREVGQSYITAILSTVYSFFCAFYIVWRIRPDVVLSNGPGTAFPVCVASFLLDFFRIRNIRIHFVESYCRVNSLSLTGKILYNSRITDSFIVQWQDLKSHYPRSQFFGRLY